MEPTGNGGGGGSLLLLTGAALLLFKPKELPMLARATGRLVGAGVRGMRRARESALSIASEAESSGTRTRLSQTIRTVDAIAGRLRAELTPLGFNARAYVAGTQTSGKRKRTDANRSDMTPEGSSTKKDGNGVEPRGMAVALTIEKHDTARDVRGSGSPAEGMRVSIDSGDGRGETGADVMASVVEEAAFAEQHARIVGHSEHGYSRKPS